MYKRSDALYIGDILESAHAINEFTDGITFDFFVHDRKTHSAVIREFEIIGEAVGKLSKDLKVKYPDTLWRDIKGFRNKLIHEYFGVDDDIVWSIIKNDLPRIETLMQQIQTSTQQP